jgi:hypothetical protein
MLQNLFDELGEAQINPATIAQLAQQADESLRPHAYPHMASERDRKQLGVLQSHAGVMKTLPRKKVSLTADLGAQGAFPGVDEAPPGFPEKELSSKSRLGLVLDW